MRFDVYGWHKMPLGRAQAILRDTLDLVFTAHESSYIGEYYASTRETESGEEEIVIQQNLVDENGDLMEEDFPEHRTLVYINGSDRWDELDKLLASVAGLQLLRTEHVG